MQTRLDPGQLKIMERLVSGPTPFAEATRWDQRKLRGLWMRALVRISGRFFVATRLGTAIFQAYRSPEFLRKDPSAPLFRAARER